MPVLRIEHPVPDFDAWKQVFDSDPAGRKASGVRRYAISRPMDDDRFISVDLDFDTLGEAEAFVARMRELWAGTGARVSSDQRARLFETVEWREL